MQVGNAAALRLKAVVEADPGALVRVLQFFQARNLIPRTVAIWPSSSYILSSSASVPFRLSRSMLPTRLVRCAPLPLVAMSSS